VGRDRKGKGGMGWEGRVMGREGVEGRGVWKGAWSDLSRGPRDPGYATGRSDDHGSGQWSLVSDGQSVSACTERDLNALCRRYDKRSD